MKEEPKRAFKATIRRWRRIVENPDYFYAEGCMCNACVDLATKRTIELASMQAKPKEEWVDITKELDFKFTLKPLGEYYYPTFRHGGDTVLLWAGGEWDIYGDAEEWYKIEYDDAEAKTNFRIMKKVTK